MFHDAVGMSVGDAVVIRRGELEISRAELARRADVDPKTLQALEQGTRWPQAVNRAKIERALGWKTGSLETIRDGGEPTIIPGTPVHYDTAVQAALGARFAEQAERMSKAIRDMTPGIDLTQVVAPAMRTFVRRMTDDSKVIAELDRAMRVKAAELLPTLLDLLDDEQRGDVAYGILAAMEDAGIDTDPFYAKADTGADGDGPADGSS